MKKPLGYRLLDCIHELNEYLISEEKIMIAIYARKIDEKIEQGLIDLENNLKSQSEVYGINFDNYAEKIEEIKSKYLNEINKIKEEYQVKFINFILELREANGNKEIALANAKKIMDSRKDFLKTEKYKEYIELKAKLEFGLNNTLKKAEYDKYFSELQNLKDPAEEYIKKRDMAIEKYNNMENIIKICEDNIKKCEKEALEKLDSTIKSNIEVSLITMNQNVISKIINKIVNKFSGKSKFEGNIAKIENNIQKLEKQNEKEIEEIRNETINQVAEIHREKNKLKNLNVA